MDTTEDYKSVNQKLWNERVDHHLQSSFYDMAAFRNGESSLKAVELGLLGDLSNKSVLHLQCHFGQDSISMAKLGAQVTGVDLSNKAIETAQSLATEFNANAQFVCADVYDAPNHITQKFDVVFTSYGTIGWLPDLNKWANVIAHFLKPGGKLVFVEFHPVVWMMDEKFNEITYNYFTADAIVETSEGTYANPDAAIKTESVSWNHGLGEVVQALLKNGLRIEDLNEYNYSPYPCFDNIVETSPGKWQVKGKEGMLPMHYSILASKTQ